MAPEKLLPVAEDGMDRRFATRHDYDFTLEYSNGEVTIIWQPSKCIHATFCFAGLPEVFKPHLRPWVDPFGASTERIVEQVEQCPSGALTYRRKGAQSA